MTELVDSSYEGFKRLFLLTYDNTAGNNQDSAHSFKKYFLPRVKIENYKIEIDGRNFYDQSINYLIKQCGKVRHQVIQQVVYLILLILKKIKN